MTRCADIRKWLLEADLGDREAGRDPEVAHHVRVCADCGALAQRIARAESGFAARLATAQPRRSLDQILEAARGRRAAAARGRSWWVAAPLAAAAVLLLLLARDASRGSSTTAQPDVIADAPRVEVVPPAGRSVAVFETDNPNITVIWFF